MRNKKGGLTDIFLFMIIGIVIVFISGVFIYIGGTVTSEVHTKMDTMTIGTDNVTVIIDDTLGKVNTAYQSLYWISIMLIVGMILSIFIGSYLVTTKPIFFVPYIFILIIAIVTSVGLSNAYEMVINDPTLKSTFDGFIGANFILSQLPIWVTIIGFIGGIIMFARLGSREQQIYGGSY